MLGTFFTHENFIKHTYEPAYKLRWLVYNVIIDTKDPGSQS